MIGLDWSFFMALAEKSSSANTGDLIFELVGTAREGNTQDVKQPEVPQSKAKA